MKPFTLNKTLVSKLVPAAFVASFCLSACGPTAFVPANISSNQSLAGNMNIPPKVDIIMGISMNGTMKNIYPSLETEIPNFVQGLQNSGWDYRFVTIPLSQYTPGATYSAVGQVAASHYETNWPASTWIPPFPGALYSDPSLKLFSSLFSYIFVFPSVIDPLHNDGHETGVKNEVDFINSSTVRNHLIRSDALLAVITLSNGEDRSGGSWVYAGWGPATNLVWQADASSNLSTYEASLISLKGGPTLVKYYSLVAHLTTTCRGYGSWSGIRYEQIANDLGGAAIDICTNTISSALGSVAANLQAQKLLYVKNYLVIGTEPNVSTIQVTKYINGDPSQSQTIPQDGSNGWTYAGYMTNTDTIESPVPMDAETGYFIQLHGSAILHGNDTANVNYLNAGTGSSH